MSAYLELPVATMPPLPIPGDSYDAVRNQYISTRILKAMIREIPPDALKVLGVIDRDLCIPILTFVFGEAQLSGPAAVVSLTRLRQEFHGLSPDPPLFRERLRKEALHELGHTFGLTHCRTPECVMALSNTIVDVDRKGRAYCRRCRSALFAGI